MRKEDFGGTIPSDTVPSTVPMKYLMFRVFDSANREAMFPLFTQLGPQVASS